MAGNAPFSLPKRWPLVNHVATRDGAIDKDARIINGYAELDPETGEYLVRQRLGVANAAAAYPQLSGNGRGMFTYSRAPGTAEVIYAFGTKVVRNGVQFALNTTPGGKFWFTQLSGGSPNWVLLGDGNSAYYCDHATLTKITDVNFPAAFVPGWAYLDGTIYVMDTNCNIFGSKNFDDPTVWDPLNKIVAKIEPDGPVALVKSLVYVVALKQTTTEIFYDAANPVGSPLAPVQGGFLTYGCVSADSVQEIDGTLLWLTSNKTVSPQVIRMDNLQVQIVSTPPIERFLDVTQFGGFQSFTIKHGGHRFYVLTVKEKNATIVYDLDQNLWYFWFGPDNKYWPYMAAAYDVNSKHLVQHDTNGLLYYIDTDYNQNSDDGLVFPVDIYTPNFDAKIARKKMLTSMYYNNDKVSGTQLAIRFSDDDYGTWSNFRYVDLGQKRPRLGDWGTFQRRAFHLRKTGKGPFRITSVDLQMEVCTL